MYRVELKLIKLLEDEKETIMSFHNPLEAIQRLFDLAIQWTSEEIQKKKN